MNKKFIPLILLSTALLMTGCAKKEKSNSGDAPTSGQPGQTSQTPTGSVVEFTSADFSSFTTRGEMSVTKSNVVVTVSDGIYNTNYSEMRVYKNATLTISGVSFTKVVMTFSDFKSGDDNYDASGLGPVDGWTAAADNLSGTWTGSSSSLVFTASGHQVRPTKISVTVA